MIIKPWYYNTAVHMWRFYFRAMDANPDKMTEPNKLNWQACDRVFKITDPAHIDAMRMYYMTEIGKFNDMKAVKDYSSRNGMPEADIWDIINTANYSVIVERGLMDRRDKPNE